MVSPFGEAGSGGGSVTVTTSPGLTAAAGSRIVRPAIVTWPAKDQGLQMGARKCRDVCSEHAVEPRACLVIGNRDCLDNTIGHGSKHV